MIAPEGPMVNAALSVSDARRAALLTAGQTIPDFVPIRALLDTGASCTCVDPSVISALGLAPTGSISMVTPSTGTTPHQAAEYDAALVIPAGGPGQPPLIFGTIGIVESHLFTAQGFYALIGRNVLAKCIFHYNGGTGLFTLAY